MLVFKYVIITYNIQMQDIRKIIGVIVRNNRKKVRMTQGDLAYKVGVDPKYISRIETGMSYPSLSVVEKIFDVLNINVINLFEEEHGLDKNNLIASINENLRHTSLKNIQIISDIVETITSKY